VLRARQLQQRAVGLRASMCTATARAAVSWMAGRGRSNGRLNASGRPASAVRQYAS